MIRFFAIAITLFLSTFGPSLVIAMVGKAAMNAVGRNPVGAPTIMLGMVTAFVFAEAMAVVAMFIVYNLFK
jgi:F0F1-type ATP synthase membrane subunit c/vacuolar-type H+-ATPase subunit K